MIMNQFKRAQVIMLPTDKIDLNTICLNKVTGLFLCTKQHLIQNVFNTLIEYKSAIPQHLYIISDDEIKQGDYFLADNRISQSSNNGIPNWVLCKCIKVKNTWIYCDEIPGEGHNGDWCKKIIATTDSSLNLPQPSQQFIEKYIESYNKDEIITNVLVEYDNLWTGYETVYDEEFGDCQEKAYESFIKTNSKNNTITIKKVKDNWNREEIFALITTFNNAKVDASNVVKWIEENL